MPGTPETGATPQPIENEQASPSPLPLTPPNLRTEHAADDGRRLTRPAMTRLLAVFADRGTSTRGRVWLGVAGDLATWRKQPVSPLSS